MRINDTIAAVSTAMSEGGIGIVRVCGEAAFCIVDKIYKGKKKLAECESHTIQYGHILSGESKEIIDEVLVMLMRAPRSYTGEDTVEINCHGGVLLLQRILSEAIRAGASLAEPGEFTKRAFLNGKLDLSSAEAVIDIIEAKNAYALKSGMQQLKGGLKREISEIRALILEETAYIEAALDDPEHYDLEGYKGELKEKVETILFRISELIKTSESGRVIKEGIDTVIIGRPNVGKSSILNLLAKSERAIVSDIAGTTRDTITEHIKMAGISLNITDTAGIRESDDIVESIGIKKARDAAKNADLIICVIDASEDLKEEDLKILDSLSDKKNCIILLNKTDKENKIKKEEIGKFAAHPVIVFSVKEEQGLDEMENKIKEMFYKGSLDFNDQVYITNLRHKHALEEARASLNMVLDSIENGLPEDFFSIDLIDAYQTLGTIIGESISDDLVNEIFSKFCMGK